MSNIASAARVERPQRGASGAFMQLCSGRSQHMAVALLQLINGTAALNYALRVPPTGLHRAQSSCRQVCKGASMDGRRRIEPPHDAPPTVALGA